MGRRHKGVPVGQYLCRSCGIEYAMVAKSACTSIKAAILTTDGQSVPGDIEKIHDNPWWHPKECDPKIRFTFVRHPLDRLVSCYVDKVQSGRSHQMGASLSADCTLREFVSFIVNRIPRANAHYAPQSNVLYGKKLDFVGRFENLENDWRRLQQLSPGLADLGHYNHTKRTRHWSEMFDTLTLRLAMSYYANDFQRWPEYAEVCHA